MKKEQIVEIFKLAAIPALVTALGVILVVNPDSATVLVSRILGWAAVAAGAFTAISLANRHAAGSRAAAGWFLAAIAVVAGVAILANPLILAEWIGRILGIVLVVSGLANLRESADPKGRSLAIVTLVIGAVLIFLPLTLTRTILRLCGLVVAVIGVVTLIEKLRTHRLLEAGDPNIIDADE